MLMLLAIGLLLLVVFCSGTGWLLAGNLTGNAYANVASTILIGAVLLVTIAAVGLFIVWPPL
ncbi:MAG: hypothetical protein ACYCX4_05955 [Bacillota bacterium]